MANFSLIQVYSRIVDSAAFQSLSAGQGWVTTFGGLQRDGTLEGSYNYVIAQFVLTIGDYPSGYVQAWYNLETGGVAAENTGLGCAG